MKNIPKAQANDFAGRFREIISDPLNLLIERVPEAGLIDNTGKVVLHNGLRVPASGPEAYYGSFSTVLIVNRGVHEPLEEYVFQEVLKTLPKNPTMLELGAYWGHYSMWLQKTYPKAKLHLVEPEEQNIVAGQKNFAANGFKGKFTQAFVGKGQFNVTEYMKEQGLKKLDILHSDIQSFEMEMLEDAAPLLESKSIDRIFVSTHSQQLHDDVVAALSGHGYVVEISSDFDNETTSWDGFIYAQAPDIAPTFGEFKELGRQQIVNAQPKDLVNFLAKTKVS